MVIVKLGSEIYRQGKVFQFDRETLTVKDGDGSWAKGWEKMSQAGASPKHVPDWRAGDTRAIVTQHTPYFVPKHVPDWRAGDTGSKLFPPGYQKLAGPWINGVDPAAENAAAG